MFEKFINLSYRIKLVESVSSQIQSTMKSQQEKTKQQKKKTHNSQIIIRDSLFHFYLEDFGIQMNIHQNFFAITQLNLGSNFNKMQNIPKYYEVFKVTDMLTYDFVACYHLYFKDYFIAIRSCFLTLWKGLVLKVSL